MQKPRFETGSWHSPRSSAERLREVAPGVLVATSGRDHTNSTVVTAAGHAERDRALVIDPAWTESELLQLAADLAARDLIAVAGLATHAHYDHLLWHPALPNVTRWASPETARRAVADRAALLAELGDGYSVATLELFGALVAVPVATRSSATLPWPGVAVQLIEHDAHIPGHLAAWLPDSRILIAGDMLSDIELPLPDDEPEALARYRAGLDALAPFAERAALVIPGHGTPGTDGRARLARDRAYLDAVMSLRDVDDARLSNPGMQEAHAETVALARRELG